MEHFSASPARHSLRWACAAWVVLLCVGCGTTATPAPMAAPAAAVATGAPHDRSPFSALAASRGAAVVDIRTLRIGRDESLDDPELEIAPEHGFADRLAWPLAASARISQIRDLASGLIIGSDGLILTAAHVVAGIDEAQVQLDDGRRFSARVVGADRRTDIGLLKIEATGLPTAVIGDSSRLAAGDPVVAISSPFGFHGSVTTGVVSALDRVLGGAGDIPFIQTDVVINPGSSGSPLFNRDGEVVGINSMIYSGSGGYMGLSFAVPINLAMRIANQLRASGVVRRAYLGAGFQALTPALAQAFALPSRAEGALVVRVDPGSPAQAAGLAPGDALLRLDDAPMPRFIDLPTRIAEHAPGSRLRLEVWRDGSRRAMQATLTEQPMPTVQEMTDGSAAWHDGLGLDLAQASAAQRAQLGIEGGLFVREAAGAARSEGLRPGDVVLAVNAARLHHVEDFHRALSRLPAGRVVALLVLRDRRPVYVAVTVPARRARTHSSSGAPPS